MRSKYLINSLPNIIAAIVFATVTNIPAPPAISQTLTPAVTVTKIITSSPSTPAGYPVTYKIVVTNTGTGNATNVNITDVLPGGFTYNSTVIPSLAGGADRVSGFTNPSAGDTTPTWNNFTIPPTGSVTIEFIARTNSGLVAQTYQNSFNVAYKDVGGSPFTVAYDGNSSTAEDVTLTTPSLSQPVGSSSPPPAISNAQLCGKPGADGVGDLSGIVNTYFAPTAVSANVGSIIRCWQPNQYWRSDPDCSDASCEHRQFQYRWIRLW
jgi:uncharacterized repeat protein (TIGR01451 family)